MKVRLLLSLLAIGLFVSTINAQYPRWLHGATGYARAVEVQHELNIHRLREQA